MNSPRAAARQVGEVRMNSGERAGRVIGMLLLVQLAGFIVPFVLLLPLNAAPEHYLANVAASVRQVKLAVVLLFANSALTLGIALAAFPILRPRSHAMAIGLVTVGAILFALQAVDNAHLLSIVSLSQRVAEADASDAVVQGLAALARSMRRWVHWTALLAIDAWLFLLFGTLLRFALVPRPLAAFGLVTVVLHFAGTVLPMFLGTRIVTLMGASMGLGELALALWLLVRGFGERPSPSAARGAI